MAWKIASLGPAYLMAAGNTANTAKAVEIERGTVHRTMGFSALNP